MGRAIIFIDPQPDFVRHFAKVDCTQVFDRVTTLMGTDYPDMETYHFTTGHKNDPGQPFFGKGPGKWREHCTAGAALLRLNGWDTWLVNQPLTASALDSVLPEKSDYKKRTIWQFMTQQVGLSDVILCGMGLELGVRSTALDARKRGLKVTVTTDLCVPYNLEHEHEGLDAVLDMEDAGVQVVTSSEFLHGRAQQRRQR